MTDREKLYKEWKAATQAKLKEQVAVLKAECDKLRAEIATLREQIAAAQALRQKDQSEIASLRRVIATQMRQITAMKADQE